jgi:hypothetical protein
MDLVTAVDEVDGIGGGRAPLPAPSSLIRPEEESRLAVAAAEDREETASGGGAGRGERVGW